MEIQVAKIDAYDKKLHNISQSVNQISHAIEENRENSNFIERQLPVMTHIAIVEGMHQLAISDELHENVLEFDKAKMTEFANY